MTLKNLQNPDWCAEICDITFFLPSPAHFSWVNEQRQNTKMGKIFLVKCPNCSNSIRLCVGGGPHRSSWKSTWEFVFSVAWVILCIIILMILTWNYILNFGQNKERSLSGPTELARRFFRLLYRTHSAQGSWRMNGRRSTGAHSPTVTDPVRCAQLFFIH